MAKEALESLSVQELESLQERVSKQLTRKLCEEVVFEKFSFEPCDDRSMGSLKFTAKTKHGVLAFSAYLGNGYSDDVQVSLDGETEGDGLDCLEVPDFHDDTDTDEAKRDCAKAVLAFETAYAEFLADE